MQAVQRQRSAATAAVGPAGAASRRRGRAPLLGRRAPREARAHEQTVRRDAGGVPAIRYVMPTGALVCYCNGVPMFDH